MCAGEWRASIETCGGIVSIEESDSAASIEGGGNTASIEGDGNTASIEGDGSAASIEGGGRAASIEGANAPYAPLFRNRAIPTILPKLVLKTKGTRFGAMILDEERV